MNIEITIGASHRKRVDRLNRRQIRKMSSSAVRKACQKMRIKGINPISAVDDLSVHSIGSWIDDFSIGLSQAAKKENISIIGGEIAQMGSVYRSGYIGVVVYVVGIK